LEEKLMPFSLNSRVVIVPHGESHFEVRYFDDENEERYRSWCLPLMTVEQISRWWLGHSLHPEENFPNNESSYNPEIAEKKARLNLLLEVVREQDILKPYRGTPIAAWLRYHNLGEGPHCYDSPQLLIVTCTDYFIHLHVPKRFAYVLRLAGFNQNHREFDLSRALAFAGMRYVCVVGHTDCAMEALKDKRKDFASGLERIGSWSKVKAAEQFDLCVPAFHILHVVDFTLFLAGLLERKFPEILVAPIICDVKYSSLYQIAKS
jgi:hypothetical protein